jgi:hypothetical protein
MLNNYRLYLLSSALFFLSEAIPVLSLLKVVALVPFLLELSKDTNLKQQLIGAFIILSSWSLALLLKEEPNGYPILNGLSLVLFIISKSSLGKQRSSIALLFFWLSAEALPYSFSFLRGWSFSYSQSLFELSYLTNWLSITGFLGASFWLFLLNLIALRIMKKMRKPIAWKTLVWSAVAFILLGIASPVFLSPESTYSSFSEYPAFEKALLAPDLFLSRMSFFLAFFLLLFLFVKHILRNSKRDDRFT